METWTETRKKENEERLKQEEIKKNDDCKYVEKLLKIVEKFETCQHYQHCRSAELRNTIPILSPTEIDFFLSSSLLSVYVKRTC